VKSVITSHIVETNRFRILKQRNSIKQQHRPKPAQQTFDKKVSIQTASA